MSNKVQQMHQALIRTGMSASQLAGLNEEQLIKLCNEKLRASLVGNSSEKAGEGFFKEYKYNQKLTLQDGTEVKVAQVASSVLKSGRKVETYIDVAGNQYFKYFSADGKELKESDFNKQEKFFLGDELHFMNGKLYKTSALGQLTAVESEPQRVKPVKQQFQEQKRRDDLAKKPTPKEDAVTLSKQLQEKFASEKDGSLIRKLSSAIDMGNYAAIPTIIANDFEYGLDTNDAGVKDIVHKVLFNMGPNQIDAMIRWVVDDNNDENLSLSEKIYNRIADVSKALDNTFVGSQGLVIAAFPPAVGMLPEVTAGVVTAGVTAPVIADGIVNTVEGVSDLMNAETEEETSAATQKLATGVIEDAAGIGIAGAVIGRGVKIFNIKGLKTKFSLNKSISENDLPPEINQYLSGLKNNGVNYKLSVDKKGSLQIEIDLKTVPKNFDIEPKVETKKSGSPNADLTPTDIKAIEAFKIILVDNYDIESLYYIKVNKIEKNSSLSPAAKRALLEIVDKQIENLTNNPMHITRTSYSLKSSEGKAVLRQLGIDEYKLNRALEHLNDIKKSKGSVDVSDVEAAIKNMLRREYQEEPSLIAARRTALALFSHDINIWEIYGVEPQRFKVDLSYYSHSTFRNTNDAKARAGMVQKMFEKTGQFDSCPKVNQYNSKFFEDLYGKIGDDANYYIYEEQTPLGVQFAQKLYNLGFKHNTVWAFIKSYQRNPIQMSSIMNKLLNLKDYPIKDFMRCFTREDRDLDVAINLLNNNKALNKFKQVVENPQGYPDDTTVDVEDGSLWYCDINLLLEGTDVKVPLFLSE